MSQVLLREQPMRKEDALHLESILKGFEQRVADSKDARDLQQSKEDAFYIEFDRIRTQIIRPAMEDIETYLKGRGHGCEISEVGDEKRKRDAKITMSITVGTPTSAYATENVVSISFARAGHSSISIHAVTSVKTRRTFTGPRGNYAASEITTDLVQKTILEVLKEIFNPT
jgi:hypothetical protein